MHFFHLGILISTWCSCWFESPRTWVEHPRSYWNLSGLRIWTKASMKNETHIKSYKIEAIQVWKKIIKPQTFPRVPPSFRYFVSSCNSFLRLLWLLASPRFNVFEKMWRGVCLVETDLQPTKFVQQCVGLCHHALVPWILFSNASDTESSRISGYRIAFECLLVYVAIHLRNLD